MYKGINFRSHLIAAALMRSMAVDVGIEEKKRERGIRWSSTASAWREEQLGFHLPVEHVTRPVHLKRTLLQCEIDAAFTREPSADVLFQHTLTRLVIAYHTRNRMSIPRRLGKATALRAFDRALRAVDSRSFAIQSYNAELYRTTMEKRIPELLQSIANQYGVTHTITYTIER